MGLRWELYQLKMESGTNLQDHINNFNQLVCQLQNAYEKIPDQEQSSLLLLASLPKSYRPIVQNLLVGREKITLDEAITVVREYERMISAIDGASYHEGQALVVEGFKRGRNQSRGDGPRSRSKSRPRDYSNIECYYCHEKGHLKYNCPKLKEDLKELKQLLGKLGKMKMGEGSDSSNVVSDDYEVEMLLTHDVKEDVSRDKWVLGSAASIHVCQEKAMFDMLQQGGDFEHINLGSDLKVEGLESVQMRLHDGMVRTFHNVRFVPNARVNLISLGEMTRSGHRYVGSGRIIARESRSALALTSANLTGHRSSVCIKDFESLWGHCAYVCDGVELPMGRAGFTIVDLTSPGKYKIIRPGSAREETIEILKKHFLVEEKTDNS
uniref:CCHC-type domain-containing protein n=1 Tax=Chenopodium quinoa TaxID=63459 RepID=A0A803LIZ5_CHEQI